MQVFSKDWILNRLTKTSNRHLIKPSMEGLPSWVVFVVLWPERHGGLVSDPPCFGSTHVRNLSWSDRWVSLGMVRCSWSSVCVDMGSISSYEWVVYPNALRLYFRKSCGRKHKPRKRYSGGINNITKVFVDIILWNINLEISSWLSK